MVELFKKAANWLGSDLHFQIGQSCASRLECAQGAALRLNLGCRWPFSRLFQAESGGQEL